MGAKNSSSGSSIPEIDKGHLRRILGVFEVFSVGYADLGSSIFYALGITALFALGATPIALALAGVVFICTSLSYAEMSSIYHDSGGSASFARHAFNDTISFIAGWGLLLDYIVTIALSSFTIIPYLTIFFPIFLNHEVRLCCTIVIILIVFAINFVGIKDSTKVSSVLMVFTLAIEIVLIGVGLAVAPHILEIFKQLTIGVPGASWSPSWHDFLKGTAMAMVAYTGIESMAQLGSETRKPARTVPRSMMVTMVILILMYMGMAVTALSLMTPEQLGGEYKENPIQGIALSIPFGVDIFLPLVSVLAVILLFAASNSGLIGASRLSFNMGAYYQLPRFFHKIHPRFRTPYAALIFFTLAAIAIVILCHGHMEIIADLYNFGCQIAFFATHASLIVMRWKKPHQRKLFKVPFNIKIKGREIPITAVLGALATLAVWILVIITKPEGRNLGIVWMLIGLAMFFWYRKKKNIPASAQVTIEKIEISKFTPLSIKKILVPLGFGTQIETVQVACELAKLHSASIHLIHIIDIPSTLPLNTLFPDKVEKGTHLLRTGEALVLDYGLNVEVELIRSRRIEEAILQIIRQRSFDLVILGTMKSTLKSPKGVSEITEKILSESPCRVWICGIDYTNATL
jgi:APA family basic amino acid/polyamine antiporter